MNENTRILVIGLDGGTWTVLQPLIDEGRMPNLAKLVKTGTSGFLESTLPPLTPPAWASFQTGVHPAKHGIYDFTQYRPGSYMPVFVSSVSLDKKTIWRILGEAGRKVILIGVPLTYPPQEVNGIVVSGLLTPSLKSNFTYPPQLKRDLFENIGEYRFAVSQDTFFSKGLDRFVSELIDCENKRVEAAEYMLQEHEWDVAMLQFQSIDNLQHALWPLLDPASEMYSPEKWQVISSFFQAIDRGIGKIQALAGDNTNVILMSDHGFGPLKRIVFLNRWLEARGFLSVKGSVYAKSVLHATELLNMIDVFKLRRLFLNYEKRESLLSLVTQETAIDWSRTYCSMLSGSQVANIYINLLGRDSEGVVDPMESGRVREDLKAQLENFKDPETGQPIVKRVYYREDISSGDLASAPDLLVEPQDGYLFTRGLGSSSIFETPQFGRNEVGCHRTEGVFVLYGPDFRASGAGWKVHIVDVPATILALMGIGVPPHFDGAPIEFALQLDILRHELQSADETVQETRDEVVYSEEDEQILAQRLRDLGYL